MNFIRAWQSLPEYGISLFVVKFHGEKKDELLGVSSNRIMRMTLPEGNHLKTWRYSTMKAWNVNWETRHMMIQFEDDKNVIFQVMNQYKSFSFSLSAYQSGYKEIFLNYYGHAC